MGSEQGERLTLATPRPEQLSGLWLWEMEPEMLGWVGVASALVSRVTVHCPTWDSVD